MKQNKPADGWIAASIAEIEVSGQGPCILSPLTASLDPHLATMACALPVGDANGMLLEATERGTPTETTLAGVFAHDPFRRPRELLHDLRDRGIRAVVNWPSVAPLNGELAAALDHSGFTYKLELALLRTAAAAGLRTAVVVFNEGHLEAALAQNPELVIITPGLGSPDGEERRDRARAVTALVGKARAETSAEIRVHMHPGFAPLLREQLPEDIGLIRHRNADQGK